MSIVATPDPTTGTVRIDVDQKILLDQFSRTVANGWGTPDIGPAWVVTTGPAADFSVSGGLGRISNAASGVPHTITNPNVHTDFDITYTTHHTASPGVGEAWFWDNRMRESVGQFVAIQTRRDTTLFQFSLAYASGGVTITDINVVVPDVSGPSVVLVRFRGCGNTLMVKVWGTALEPTAWTRIWTIPNTFAGTASFRTFLTVVGTALPISLTWDNLIQVVNQPLRLFRVTPDGVRTEVRGSPFNTDPLWSTAVTGSGLATVWDNEAPLDTQIFYELTSTCTTEAAMTSNTIQLLSNGDGWLRDPTNPSNNIRIAFEDTQFNLCDATNRVVLTDWEPRTYRNASGQFDILNSQRPTTIAMRRKRYDSSMTFASKSLSDVDDLEALIAPGSVLLLSLPAAYGFGRPYGTDFITVQDVVQDPVDTDDYQTPYRSWEVPFMLSGPPADTNEGLVGGNGIGGGGATYADLAASALGTTYATLAASGQTYQQVAQGVGY